MLRRRKDENFLDMIPRLRPGIQYESSEAGGRIQFVRQGRWFNFVQKVFPATPQVLTRELDPEGARVIEACDGVHTVAEIGKRMQTEFMHTDEEVYGRLIQFLSLLHRAGIIEVRSPNSNVKSK